MEEGIISEITILAATEAEISGLQSRIEEEPLSHLQISFLISGVSMVNASFALGRYLASHHPDMIIQIGIAGSFSQQYPVGSVVEVKKEIFPEIGAESPEGWLTLDKLGFPLLTTKAGDHYNSLEQSRQYCRHLPQVTGITVNSVSGTQASIDRLTNIWRPDIETMEGGAFFHAMKQVEIPFMQLRGISNLVEPRNKEAWQIGTALSAVQEETYRFLADFRKK